MILDFVRRANQTFVAAAHSRPFTTTSSIAYGSFDYQNRKETADLRKNYLFGRPYVNVASDQKKGRPKIRPGECRLLDKCVLRRKRTFGDPLLSCVMKRGRRRYFYWMLKNPDDRDDFEREYKEAYKHKKRDNYAGVIRVLQRYAAGRGPQRDMGTLQESPKRTNK